jgi:uncharacterized membrane protein
MKRITKYFLQGLLYLAPFGITVYIIYAVFKFADSLLKSILLRILNVDIPGLGLIIVILLIILTGLIGRTFIARPFKLLFNRFMDKAPFLKVIYSALNDLFSAFVGKERKFDKPVLVLVNPVSNLEKLGFLTEDDLTKLNVKDKVAVYFPHSYNFSGELFIVPKENVKPVNLNPAEAMKFIVSAGISGWEDNKNGGLSEP